MATKYPTSYSNLLLEVTENEELVDESSDDEHDNVEEDRHSSEIDKSVLECASDNKSANLGELPVAEDDEINVSDDNFYSAHIALNLYQDTFDEDGLHSHRVTYIQLFLQ